MRQRFNISPSSFYYKNHLKTMCVCFWLSQQTTKKLHDLFAVLESSGRNKLGGYTQRTVIKPAKVSTKILETQTLEEAANQKLSRLSVGCMSGGLFGCVSNKLLLSIATGSQLEAYSVVYKKRFVCSEINYIFFTDIFKDRKQIEKTLARTGRSSLA